MLSTRTVKTQFSRKFVASSTRLAFSAHSSILVAGLARPRQPRYATNDAGVEISVNFEMLWNLHISDDENILIFNLLHEDIQQFFFNNFVYILKHPGHGAYNIMAKSTTISVK